MTDRLSIDELTSDALDDLYAETDRLAAELGDYEQRVEQLTAELAAFRTVSRGYCSDCGRGDAAAIVADWEQQKTRADQAEAELARYTEAESADAAAGSYAARAETAEAALTAARRAARGIGAWGVLQVIEEAMRVPSVAEGTAAPPEPSGIRGLLEHVGIDTTGRDISVAGKVVDAAPVRCTCAGVGFGDGTCTAHHPPEPNDLDLTAQEARDLATELGYNLYKAQDALAFVGECCDVADREQRPITTGDVRVWLKGARCGRQLAADSPKGTGLVVDPAAPPLEFVTWSGPVDHHVTARPVDPEMERAATERARQAAADSERAAEQLAALSGTLYRHYKGGVYTVTGTATHTSSWERLVVYRDTEGGMWARPIAEFTGTVDGQPRFTRIEPAPAPAATEATDTTKEQ